MRIPALSLLTLLLVGCRTVPASVETTTPTPAPVFVEQPAISPVEPEPEPEPESIASFNAFIGLKNGDTVAEVRELFGEAVLTDTAGADLHTFYYVMTEDTDPDDGPPGLGDDYLFVVTTDVQTGRVFNLQANAGDYAGNNIEDPLLRFLGAPLGEVVATFGEPLRISSGFNTYEYVDEARGIEIEVEFVCYEFEDYVCREIWVSWYDPEEG